MEMDVSEEMLKYKSVEEGKEITQAPLIKVLYVNLSGVQEQRNRQKKHVQSCISFKKQLLLKSGKSNLFEKNKTLEPNKIPEIAYL